VAALAVRLSWLNRNPAQEFRQKHPAFFHFFDGRPVFATMHAEHGKAEARVRIDGTRSSIVSPNALFVLSETIIRSFDLDCKDTRARRCKLGFFRAP
jgi:hypothetical protein